MEEIAPDDLARRATASAARAYDGAAVTDVAALQGGFSSLTFSAQLRIPTGQQRIVLKVAPPGVPPVRNRDVLRQARILRALSGVAGVAVPEVLFEDGGDPPGVPPLFAMVFVDGDSFEPLVSEQDEVPPGAVVAARSLAAARMLGALHRVEPAALGIDDEPEIALPDEIDRWERTLDTVDDELRPGYREVAAALRADIPAPMSSVVSHGDWRLGNMLCRGADIAAVIDWEIWSRADPRVDLAWFLAVNRFRGNPTAVRDESVGVPSTSSLMEAYESVVGRPVTDSDWFEAFNDFKQAAILALIVKHNRRREQPDPAAEAHAGRTPVLLDQAHRRLTGTSS